MDDYGPFVVAGAAVLAAFNWQSSEQDLIVKISTVSLWEISDSVSLFSPLTGSEF